ncbi:MAG: SixA phosphatase family protein [Candidatus Nanopelagicales bacterium]|jgi:phosphohistidine phosphatase
MRTLLLLRHAKSDYPPGVADRERPLSARGERDAAAAAQWLRAAFPVIDEAVVSPATRALQTWSSVEMAVGVLSMRIDPRVYDDWGAHLLTVVEGLSAASRTALIIGHNPGIEELALELSGSAPSEARARLLDKYPTCGIAVIRFPGEWSDQSSAELVMFSVPRGSA